MNSLSARIPERILCLFLLVSVFQNDALSSDRPKIGLVLSGGGARGFAHVGVLKMLDSLDIPIDYIAGTSMGGIVGALYAIGYRGLDLEVLASRSDWQEIFTDRPPRSLLPYLQKMESGRYQLEFGLKGFKPVAPSGLIFGQKITLLFSSLTFPYEHISDFDRFPIPFRCVASDLITGERLVLKHGSLSKAMRATMAIPTVFSAVDWGDSLLVDGGLLDNLPVDVVKEMGADIVIAVDVGYPLRERAQINSAIAVMEQSMAMLGIERRKENIHLVDILIRPDLTGFSVADFNGDKIRRILERGDQAARLNRKPLIDLVERFGLTHGKDTIQTIMPSVSYRIKDIQITGLTTTPFQTILDKVGLKPGDVFDSKRIRERLAEIRTAGYFQDIRLETAPVSDREVRVWIRVREKQEPVIQEISIEGNPSLPGAFILRLLGLKTGDRLDTDIVNRRIMEMYGLGYFESIRYEIRPIREDAVRFILTVKELPLKKLRLGIRYDERHKLVAAVGLQHTNILIPGLRLENELQFAGLGRWRTRAYYPSRTLALPVYPFLELNYKDIPTRLFNKDGEQILDFNNRSADASFGLGFLLGKNVNMEFKYKYEWIHIHPGIALPDPYLFWSVHDRLQQLCLTLNWDMLDDVLLPRKGLQLGAVYEGSYSRLHSQIPYSLMRADVDFYATVLRRHTMRLYGFWCTGSGRTPVYKFSNQGRPECFVGMQYDQLVSGGMSILRMDYRYQHKKDIFIRLTANTAFGFENRFPAAEYRTNRLWGVGIGLVLLSPIGPIDVTYGRGSKSFSQNGKGQNVGYVTLGYKF